MGDRVYCTLRIGGELREEHIQKVAEAIGNFCPDGWDADQAAGDPAEMLRSGCGSMWFSEVNYGEFDADLAAALKEAGLSYEWQWSTGGGFTEGVECYDAATGEEVEHLATIDGYAAILAADLDNPERMAAARKWDRFIREFPPLRIAAPAV